MAEAQPRPTHQVLGVKHADNMFGTTLRIVDRDARVLIVDHPRQGFVQVQVGGQRKDSGPRHHHLTRGDVVEFERIQQHLFLRGRELAGVVRGGYDELEFVGGVNRAVADLAGAEGAQDETSRAAHANGQGAGDGQEDVHGRGDRQGNPLGPLQGERLRNQFAEDHVQAGDHHEGDRDGDGMSVDQRVRHASDPALEQSRQNRLAQPAQGQAGDGDSQLHAVDDAAELLVKFEDGAGAHAVGFDQLLDAGFAHADQRELGCGEEGIGRHQEQDDEHPQQHVCNHGTLILTFQRDNRLADENFWSAIRGHGDSLAVQLELNPLIASAN